MRFFSPEYTRVIGIMWHKTDRDHVAPGRYSVAFESRPVPVVPVMPAGGGSALPSASPGGLNPVLVVRSEQLGRLRWPYQQCTLIRWCGFCYSLGRDRFWCAYGMVSEPRRQRVSEEAVHDEFETLSYLQLKKRGDIYGATEQHRARRCSPRSLDSSVSDARRGHKTSSVRRGIHHKDSMQRSHNRS
jgi:hypothetical protein